MAAQNTSTNESAVFNGMSDLLRNHVLTPICQHLAQKGIHVSVEELASVLKLPASTAAPPAPQMSAFGQGVPPVATAPPSLMGLPGLGMPLTQAGKHAGKKGPTAPVPDNERCQYVFTRGRNKGQRCPVRAESGQHFCGGCKGKKSAQNQLQTGGVGGGMIAMPGQFAGQMMPNIPGTMPGQPAGLPNMMGQLNPAMAQPQQGNKIRLQVVPLGNGVYHEKSHNLAIKTGEQPGQHICCGIYDPQTATIRALTPDKIEICKQLNLTYVDPSTQGSTPAQATPQPLPGGLPALGPMQGLPATGQQIQMGGLPTAGQQIQMGGLPTAGQQIQMGGLPAVGQQSLMQPGMGGLPAVGQQIATGLPNVPALSSQMNTQPTGQVQGPALTDVAAVGEPDEGDDEDGENEE